MDGWTTGSWIGFGVGALIWFLFWIAIIYVCFEKGKSGYGWLGVLGFFFPILFVFPIVGAARIAKPSSDYATSNYHEGKMSIAVERFPDDLGPRPDWMQHHITFGE